MLVDTPNIRCAGIYLIGICRSSGSFYYKKSLSVDQLFLLKNQKRYTLVHDTGLSQFMVYTETFLVYHVLLENVLCSLECASVIHAEAHKTRWMQKWDSIVQYSCTSIWDLKYMFSVAMVRFLAHKLLFPKTQAKTWLKTLNFQRLACSHQDFFVLCFVF